MRKEDISVVAQLLLTLKELTSQMDKAERKKQSEELEELKKEAMEISAEIGKMLA